MHGKIIHNNNRYFISYILFCKLQIAQDACAWVTACGQAFPNNVKLAFYAFFKQAAEGECTSKPPPLYDVVGRAKWCRPPRCTNPMSLAAPSRQLRPSASPHREHWRQLSGLSRQDAMVQYLLLAQKLVGNLQACPCRLAF